MNRLNREEANQGNKAIIQLRDIRKSIKITSKQNKETIITDKV